MTYFRHPGLEPGSAFFLAMVKRKGGPRVKPGVTG
jgi:hypothetical protein